MFAYFKESPKKDISLVYAALVRIEADLFKIHTKQIKNYLFNLTMFATLDCVRVYKWHA